MSQTTTQTKREPKPLNGVNTPELFGAINLLTEQRDLAKFQFRATNRWQQGTHSRTSFLEFSGAGGEQSHIREYTYDADHPEVFTGRDQAPTPVEFLLHGLAGCLTAGIGNIAAARGITLYEVESRIEGDIDMQGLLGISNEVRNGYERIRVDFKIKGDADEETLRKLVERSRDRSAVFDVLTNGVPVSLTVNGEAARS